jgi:hypothetical protein
MVERTELQGMYEAIRSKEIAVRNAQTELYQIKRTIVEELAERKIYDALTVNMSILRMMSK